MKADNLLEDFLEGRNLRPSTKANYTYMIQKYCQVTGKTPTELIEEAEDEEDQGIRMRRRKIRQYLTDFAKYMEEEDYTGKHKRTAMGTVRSFYKHYDIHLPKIHVNYTSAVETIEDIPSHSDIQLAMAVASPQISAIITLMSSSGMGASEVLSLHYSDFLRSLDNYFDMPLNNPLDIGVLSDILHRMATNVYLVPTWKIKRVKTNMPYFTFSTPESVIRIIDYLTVRPPQSLDTALFRHAYHEVPLRPSGLFKAFRRINQKCGFKSRTRQAYFRSHGLRKFFASTVNKEGLPYLNTSWLLGHRIGAVDEAYFKPDPDKLREQYIKLIPKLTIMDGYIPEYNVQRMDKIEHELEIVREFIALQQQRKEGV